MYLEERVCVCLFSDLMVRNGRFVALLIGRKVTVYQQSQPSITGIRRIGWPRAVHLGLFEGTRLFPGDP